MGSDSRGTGADLLLDLDGEVLVVDPKGNYRVGFVVKRVAPSIERPHGLSYSLTLHGPSGERLIGFDNAHRVRKVSGPSGKKAGAADHRHRLSAIRPHRFRDTSTLLADFWSEVDRVLREKGVI
jgi:hypothetical protein